MASEQQLDGVIAQMQLEIMELKPKGDFANLLPMLEVVRAIVGKDLEGGNAYNDECT